jgi:hypothetical protein
MLGEAQLPPLLRESDVLEGGGDIAVVAHFDSHSLLGLGHGEVVQSLHFVVGVVVYTIMFNVMDTG